MLRAHPEHQLRPGGRLAQWRDDDLGAVERQPVCAPVERALEGQQVHRRRADEIGDEQAGRPVIDLLRRTELLHRAAIHDGDGVGHRHRLELVMGDIDRRRTDAVVQRPGLGAHQGAELGIERAERLVHQEGLRAADDGAPQRHPLPVAAGQARHLAVEQMIDPEEPRRLFHALARLPPARPLAAQRKADILPHIHMRIEREQLEHEGDVALRGAPERHILAVEEDLAGGRQLEPGNHPERRRLAAAGRPEKAEERALGNGEAQFLHRGEVAEHLAQFFDPDLSHRPIPEISRR